jgi:hypothetical protein
VSLNVCTLDLQKIYSTHAKIAVMMLRENKAAFFPGNARTSCRLEVPLLLEKLNAG